MKTKMQIMLIVGILILSAGLAMIRMPESGPVVCCCGFFTSLGTSLIVNAWLHRHDGDD